MTSSLRRQRRLMRTLDNIWLGLLVTGITFWFYPATKCDFLHFLKISLRLVIIVTCFYCLFEEKTNQTKNTSIIYQLSIRLANVAIFVCDRTVLPYSDTSSSILVCCYCGICDWRYCRGLLLFSLRNCKWIKIWLHSLV